jgi:hypothetical protein
MRLVKLSEIFNIEYGQQEYESKRDLPKGEIPLIASGGNNNGHYGYFDIEPKYKWVISIPRTGSICEAFFHSYSCCIDNNCLVVSPKIELSKFQMLYYVLCFRKHKDLYMYGRQVTPNRLGNSSIPAPEDIPEWINDPKYQQFIDKIQNKIKPLIQYKNEKIDTSNWQLFRVVDLFDIKVGSAPSIREAEDNPGNIPYISSSTTNNGIACYTSLKPNTEGNIITITKNGEVGRCFYQSLPVLVNADVAILTPKFELNKNRALFLIPLLELNKIKYSYGRKLTIDRIQKDYIRLPILPNGLINWLYIDDFIVNLL